MERKSYIKNGTNFDYDGKEYTFEQVDETYTLYYYIDDFFYPMMTVTTDKLDGECVVDYFKEQLY